MFGVVQVTAGEVEVWQGVGRFDLVIGHNTSTLRKVMLLGDYFQMNFMGNLVLRFLWKL